MRLFSVSPFISINLLFPAIDIFDQFKRNSTQQQARERERTKYKRMERERGNGNDATELDCTQSGGERVANLHTFTLHWFCCSQSGYTLPLSLFPDSNEVRLGVGTRYPFYFENAPPLFLLGTAAPVKRSPLSRGKLTIYDRYFVLRIEARSGGNDGFPFPLLPLIGKMEQIPNRIIVQSSNRCF